MAAAVTSLSSPISSTFASDAFPPLPSRSPPPKPPDPPPPSSGNPSSSSDVPDLSNSHQSFPAKSDYATLFRTSPRNAGSYKPFHFDIPRDGKKQLVPDLVKQQGLNYWNDFLIGFFLDGTLSFHAVSNYLRLRWKLSGDVDIKTDGFHFYFKFTNASDREKILRSDPVFIRGRMFIISVWDPSIGCAQSQVKKVPVWIQLYNIPMVLWTLIGINWLVNHIGRLICYDISTERLDRFRYAKALVEVSPEYELPNIIEFDGLGENCPSVKVRYDWKPRICVNCKVFGHDSISCELHANNNMDNPNLDDANMRAYHSEEHVQGQRPHANIRVNANQEQWTNVFNKKKKYWRRKEVQNNKEANNETEVPMVNVNPFSVLETDLQGNGNAERSNTQTQINGKVADHMTHDSAVANEAQETGNSGETDNIEDNNEAQDDDALFGNLFEGNTNLVDHSGKSMSSSSGMSSPDLSSPNITRPCPLSVGLATPSSAVDNTTSMSRSAMATSPYAHLKLPQNLILPPPSVSGCGLTFPRVNMSSLSSAVPPSSLPSSNSKKLKGKFWDDTDLDDGIDYNPEDVLPRNTMKSSRRHTRKNPGPMFDPCLH